MPPVADNDAELIEAIRFLGQNSEPSRPFDDIHPDGEAASIVHILEEGQIVGIEHNWGDKDAEPGTYDDAYWSVFGGVGASADADQFGDYLLAPPEDLPSAVADNTWGQIKSGI